MKLKRFLAFALSMIMVLSTLPVGVIASSETDETITVSGKFIVENFKEGTAEYFGDISIYSESAENDYCYRDIVFGEDNTWSVEFPAEYVGDYILCVMPYSYGNVFPGEYEYVDADGVPITVALNGEDVSGIDISLPTGRLISGTIELPDDAVLPETPVECGVYGGAYADGNNSASAGSSSGVSYDEYFANVQITGQTTPFDLVIENDVTSVIVSASPWVSGTDTNLSSANVYYVDNTKSTQSVSEAVAIDSASDVSGIKLYPATSNLLNIRMNRPETVTQNVSGTLKILDESGNEITYKYFQLYSDGYQDRSFSLSKEYEKVYIYFKASGYSSGNFCPYEDWLYYNPDGSFVTTMEEAIPHTLSGLTNLEFTVPDENFLQPKIKGMILFDEDVIAENVEIDVVVTSTDGYGYSKEIFNNANGNVESTPLSDGREFEFVFSEGSGLETKEYTISIDISIWENGKTNIYTGNRYYYSSSGATIVEDNATLVTPAVEGNDITFNIPKMKTLSGKIVADGEYKYLNEQSAARIIFRCEHENDNSTTGGESSGEVSGDVSAGVELMSLAEYTEADCTLDYYETEAIINKDLTFTCYVPDFMTGEHTTQLIIENMGTNLLPGWYYYTDENDADIPILFSNGETDEDISFNVETGYALSGVIKIPDACTLETSSNVKNFNANIRIQRDGYTNYDEYIATFSNTVREVPFMVAVNKYNSDECYLYTTPGYLWSYTNLNPNDLYYIDNKSTTDVQSDATLLNITGDIENIVFILKVDGEETDESETIDATFTVIDKHTRYPVPSASLAITDILATTTDTVSLVTSTEGTASIELSNGTYEIVVTKDGYVTKTEEITVSSDEYEFEIEIEKIEIAVDDNTTFYVKDGDLETTPAISGASLTIEDAEGNIVTKATDSDGKATADLEDGSYYVTAIAEGYKTRSFKIEKTDTKNSFTVYLSKDDIINVTSTVKELTKDEVEAAGIDTEAIGNKQVYNCTAVLSFMPDVSISYYYTNDGTVVKGGTPTKYGNTSVTPVGRDIYLIVKSTTSWLKEIFEVQIVCDNTSAIETVEELVADLAIPEGLSLAIMTDGEQTSRVTLGDIAPKGNESHKWYICGDVAGEYTLDGTLTGTRTGGGVSEDINLTFGIEDSITVLAGDAMTLTIDAETHGTVGEPYLMRYTLENVSDKTLYDLSFSVLGGKFFDDYGVTEAKYAREYGPDAEADLNGEGFTFETDKFKPGDKIGGLFTITFGEELLLGEGQEWILKEAFVVTGAGSTTVIPTTINWIYDVPEHDWDEGTVTKAATCTEDGEITFKCKDVDCEETYTERISATGHSMSDFVTVEPTCTEEGTETSTCQNDGCTHSVVLPLDELGHDWETDFTVDKEATCKVSGSKSIHCTRCVATKDVTEIPVIDHNWGDWQTRTPATCVADGVKYRICGKCFDEETDVIAQLGHDWDDEYTVDVQPGCETDGSKSKHCSRCEEKTDVQVIPENGHSMSAWTQTVAPTCTKEGTKRRDCGNCEYYEEDIVASNGHSWNDGVITTPGTEEKEGEKTFTCGTCGETKTEIVPVLVKQDVGFTVPVMTYTYGDKTAVYNEAYNDSEDGAELTYSSDNEKVATVDKNGKITINGAGEATITATAAAKGKYAETSATFKLTIKKASLTVKVNDSEVYYGEDGKHNGFTATGYVLGETDAVLNGTPEYKVNYNKLDKAGEYEITISGLTADNYDITFTSGKLTVKKAEVYDIELSNLSQRKGKLSEVTASVTPNDDTAKIKIEYQFTDGVWVDTIDLNAEIGEYKVRAYLTESENLAVNETPKYFEATLEVKAGAVVNLDGNSDLSIDSYVTGDNVEFTIPDEAVEEIVNNVPQTGEIVIDATGSTEGVTNLTLPENIITALDNSDDVNTFTVIADDAEISMSAEVIKTVAEEMSAGDKVNVHIEAVEKERLNEEQKAALDAIATDAHVLQLNLKVEKADGTTELHELNGRVEVKAAYDLPSDMNGKKIVVCYVSDNGTVTYMRATYKDGFVHFKTDHFSHYAIAAIECTHTWDAGTVITQATTSSEGLKRYECTICGETKDETIPKKTSYGGGGSGAATYTVKFETNGAGTIKSQTVNKNAVTTEPAVPTKEGYIFGGWYTDKELTTAYDFSAKVAKSFTLYAKWIEVEKESETEKNDTAISFTDVKEKDWFFENVQYVVENNLMNGVSETEFAPNNTLTRAMLVIVLYRHAGEPATNRSIPFADVDMGAYYANAVSWAKQNGIVSGVTENKFAPNSNITREQIATILFRYAQLNGMETITLEENLHFADSDVISEFAVSAMNWAVGKDLIKGKTATTLNPKDNATRAEIAAILQRFIENNK